MKPAEVLQKYRSRIREIALSHRVRDVRVFGSVVRNEDVEGSDLDLLVDPTDDTTLFDLGAIQFEVSELIGMPVDILTPNSLPEHFRDRVLAEAQSL